jgi:hypothetical protein
MSREESREWELFCTNDWNTKFKNKTNTTESKQRDTIDILHGNEIGFLN